MKVAVGQTWRLEVDGYAQDGVVTEVGVHTASLRSSKDGSHLHMALVGGKPEHGWWAPVEEVP